MTTRLNFIRKKQYECLKNTNEARKKVHSIYQIKNVKIFENKIKQQETQKKKHDQWIKSQQVQSFRQSLQLNKELIKQINKSRKIKDVQKFKMRRLSGLKQLQRSKEQLLREKTLYRNKIVQLHEKQFMKKKLFQLAKKLGTKDNVEQKIEAYEKEASKIYNLIERIKKEEKNLKKQNDRQEELFKSVIEDINILKIADL